MGLLESLGRIVDTVAGRLVKDSSGDYDVLQARMSVVSVEMEQFLHSMSGYIGRDQYRELEMECQQLEAEAEKPVRNNRFFRTYALNQLESEYLAFVRARKAFISRIENHNEEILTRQIEDARAVLGMVEGSMPDRQQIGCIITKAHNHLVIAGAGTGKTTTILGKVKYLLKTGQAMPKDILILSFTNAAATEMKNRLLKETNEKIYVATFHKLGYDILRRVEGIAPKVFQEDMRKYLSERIHAHMQDAFFQQQVIAYVLYHRTIVKSEFEFANMGEYREYLETNPPKTLKGEKVKSYGEMTIANYLAAHGIVYQYEAAYPLDTRTEEYGQYHPDFYLPEYDIYLEYYGINRQNRVPDYFESKDGKSASQVYLEGMAWKQKLHEDNGTTLISCFAYEHMEGNLQEKLEERLVAHGVSLQSKSFEELMTDSRESGEQVLTALAGTMGTVITLAKNKRVNAVQLLQRSTTFLPPAHQLLAQITAPLMEDYEEHLHQAGEIDFTDMLHKAEDMVRAGAFVHKFKYVIVDEYQDISAGQYQLLQAMRQQLDYELFCVGDDWQSIYRFAGSDIGYILNFEHYWGLAVISRIETTYRFSARLVDISGSFIMENPNQMKKRIRSRQQNDEYALGEVHGYTEESALTFLIDRLRELPKGSSVFFLGRYTFDAGLLKKSDELHLTYDTANQSVWVVLSGREDLQMRYYTAHRSKGLQADYVIILNNKNTHMGFPSKVENPPLVELFLEQGDCFPDAEERRLFYVALTRARKKVFLLTAGDNLSTFAKELKDKYADDIKKEQWACPRCGAPLRKVSGPYGEFYGCSSYRTSDCRYKRLIKTGKSVESVPEA